MLRRSPQTAEKTARAERARRLNSAPLYAHPRSVQPGLGLHRVWMKQPIRRYQKHSRRSVPAKQPMQCHVCGQWGWERVPAPVPLCSEQCAAQLIAKIVDVHELRQP
jgi:hypothetical protein